MYLKNIKSLNDIENIKQKSNKFLTANSINFKSQQQSTEPKFKNVNSKKLPNKSNIDKLPNKSNIDKLPNKSNIVLERQNSFKDNKFNNKKINSGESSKDYLGTNKDFTKQQKSKSKIKKIHFFEY